MNKLLTYGIALVWLVLGGVPSLAAETDGTGGSQTMDVMLVLDNSGSMMKTDPEFLTRQVVSDFLSGLDRSSRAGMVIFDENVRLALPLTDMSNLKARSAFLEALESVRYKGKYSDSPSGVERAIYELKTNGREIAHHVIILLTDGIVETGDRAMDIDRRRWLKQDLTRESQYAGIRIFGIAFTDKADFSLLQGIALDTDGGYFRAFAPGDIREIFGRITRVLTAPPKKTLTKATAQQAPPPATPPNDGSGAAAGSDTDKTPAVVSIPERTPEPATGAEMPKQPVPSAPTEPEPGIRRGTLALFGFGILVALTILFFVTAKRKKTASSATSANKGFAMRPFLHGGIPRAELVDLDDVTGRKTLLLTGRVTKLGRDESNDIVIDEDTVSSLHAVVEFRDDFFYLEDQRSKNRTYLNGEKLEPYVPRKLKSGDEIRLNVHAFTFVLNDAAPAGETIADFGVRENSSVSPATIIRPERISGSQGVPNPLQALLVDVKNTSGKKTIRIDRDLVQIGRGVHNDVVIDRKSISGSHATIQLKNGFYYLEDQRSRNKTRLNGEELEPNAPRKLKSGDEIMFDVCKFIFLLENQTPTGDTGESW